jgi:hypothetical protein
MTEWVWVWAGYGLVAVTWACYVTWALRGARRAWR